MNNQQITQIIKEAKERGYIPDKKDLTRQGYPLDIKDLSDVGFNQALSEINLEKIIELAYERGRSDEKEEIIWTIYSL